MGCSNARLLVQTPLSETNAIANLNANNPLNLLSTTVTRSNETSPTVVATDTTNTTTRMHLTGVDLVVERNGSYTLLLTPKTHKQLMPYVLRKKRFRILVDKPRLEGPATTNLPLTSYDLPNKERIMDNGKETKLSEKKGKKQTKQKMDSTIESVQQVATDELDKAKARFIAGRSIDRGDPDDDIIQSDDEGMIEEIVTTVEEDKDLECKVKKKIETKKTIAQDPETHNKITKVVKTEVTEITRTITINDQHDLERAKRELGIDDVNKLLPSTQIIYNLPSTYHSTTSWVDHPRLTEVQEKYYEPSNEIVTSGDFPSDSPIKQYSPSSTTKIIENEIKQEQPLAEATSVGRGPVVETISTSSLSSPPQKQQQQSQVQTSSQPTTTEQKSKKKKSSLNLCSCTRNTTNDYDEEQRKQKAATIVEQKSKQKKKASVTTTNALLTSPNIQSNDSIIKSSTETNIQGEQLISNDIKQLIKDKKSLIIDYIHSKIFLSSNLFTTNEENLKGKKISSRILDLLHYDRCSSWTNLYEQIKEENSDQLTSNSKTYTMVKTYEELFTKKQSNFLNTFSTIHNEKDIKHISENPDYITIVQTYINERNNQPNIDIITKPTVENIQDTIQRLEHVQSDEKVIGDDHEKQQAFTHNKDIDMTDDIKKQEELPIYNEEQVVKSLANISTDKPITLAEAIAHKYLDIEDPKLGLSNDLIQRIKNLFHPISPDDKSTQNLIRINRSGQHVANINVSDINSFEKLHFSDPFIYQLQQTFEPTLDFNEKQFRSLTDIILNNKDEYSNLQFDIGKTSVPIGNDMKESSTNDFSQSDSGYSVTTATCESLASKHKNEFEPISEPISDQNVSQMKLSDDIHLDDTHSNVIKQETTDNRNLESTQIPTELIMKKEERIPITPVYIKKRKSTGLFSCFGNKKAKGSIEQTNQSNVTPTSPINNNQTNILQTRSSMHEKPSVDHAISPDGRRIYIDAFRDRPGLDMSYKPNDFETQFVLPVAKSPSEYERSITPDNTELESANIESIEEKPHLHLESRAPTTDSVDVQAKTTEEKHHVHLEPRAPTIEPVDVQAETTEEKPRVHLEPRAPTIEPVDVQAETTEEKHRVHLEPRAPTIEPVDVQAETTEEKHRVHLEPRAPTIEPVDVQAETIEEKHRVHLEPRAPTIERIDVQLEQTPIVIPVTKKEESTHTKPTTALHGAPVDLPEIELVKPGPLPTLTLSTDKNTKKTKEPITNEKPAKTKKSTGGLCASCFGSKAAEKTKKQTTSEPIKAPIEQKKIPEKEKQADIPPPPPPPPPTTITALPTTTVTAPPTTTETEPITTTTTPIIVSSPTPVLPSTTDHTTNFTEVDIDTFKERTFQKSAAELPKLDDRLDATIENLVSTEEPHYQLPSSEPVPPISVENEYSLPESNTYDIPRSADTPSVENIQINLEEKLSNTEILPPLPTIDIEKSPNDIISKEPIIQSTITTTTTPILESMPNVEINPTSTKGSYTLPSTKETKTKKDKQKKSEKKKSGLFSNLFRHGDRKTKIPSVNLPSVENNLTSNNQKNETNRRDSDPLRIPSTNLPKPDVSLPTYNQPEVNMISGQIDKSLSSEFSIPANNLPSIPNLELPDNDKKEVNTHINQIKIPLVELPEVKYTSDEKQNLTNIEEKLPEIPLLTNIKLEKDIEEKPIIENNLTLTSPIQTDQIDSTIKTDVKIPDLPNIPSNDNELIIKPELLSTEQKYTITDTHFVHPPELPIIVEKHTVQHTESPPKLPDFTFELPSIEPVSTLTNDINQYPPSFDDVVPTTTSKIVPAIEVSTLPIKTTNKKEIIEPKSDVKKKSSTLGLCSCFGNKSNIQKDKTKTISSSSAPTTKTDASQINSNISTTKSKISLRAPSNDLPPVDLTLPSTEPIRLTSTDTHEKKRPAPKKPSTNQENISPPITSPEAVVPTIITTSPLNQTIVPTIQTNDYDQSLTQPSIIEKDIKQNIHTQVPIPSSEILQEEKIHHPSSTNEIKIESPKLTSNIEKQSEEQIKETHTESKPSPSFEIKAPVLNIPDLDLSGPIKTDSYISPTTKQDDIQPIITQSRSDSGLEAIISSHIHPSSTFDTNQTIEDLNQHPSISSGLGSEIIDNITSKTSTLSDIQQEKISHEPKRENSLLRHDFTRKITMNDDTRAKLIFRQNELKKLLENEISKSIEDFDVKKDQKSLNKILTHGIDLIKDKKVTTYPELKQKLIVEHKNDAFIVDPVVRSLYCTLEKQGLDNLDKPEFPLAIRDMVRLPAKQTFDTVAQLNKTKTEETPRITQDQSSKSSCLTCGRSKTKQKIPSTTATTTTTNTGLLDERRRLQLNTHRNELGNTLRDHIQSSQPPIRQFSEHPKEVDKILRKSLTLITQPKILSYEQIRNDLKTEYKQTFYLVDPTVDIIRDTFDHCDITQMNEKINLDILDSNITQTSNLYNQINNQTNLLTLDEYNNLKSNNLTWLNQYLIDNELKDKKSSRKQNKELHKILNRTLDLLSLNLIYTWDELNSQLRREFPKAHNLCDRAIELMKQSQKDGLLLLQQSPLNNNQQDITTINIINSNGKRRVSSLITERAKQNLKQNRKKILLSIRNLLYEFNKPLYTENQIELYINKAFHYLEEQKLGEFKTYNDLKDRLKNDFKNNHEKLIEQIVDVIEQAHATNQFDDIDKAEVQTLMKDRLDGKPLVIKEMYVSLPPRAGAYGTSKHLNDDTTNYLSASINGDRTLNNSTSSHRVGRGLSWREANERARILFYRGKHPAIHYDEQAAAFDVRMLLETTTGGTQEIPVTDSDVHELLNSCGVQWDGVNIISLVDHSEDVVRAAEQAALKVIREKGLVDLRTPPPSSSSTRNPDDNDEISSS